MTLKSLARPDRRMISPPAAPVAYSVVRLLIYTAGAVQVQQWNQNVLAKAEFAGYSSVQRKRSLRAGYVPMVGYLCSLCEDSTRC